MISRLALSAAALAVSAGVASAGLIFETEPNSTLATAEPIGPFVAPGDSLAIDGFITPGTLGQDPDDDVPGDVDWFTFTVTDLAFIGVTAFAFDLGGAPFGGTPSEADSVLQLVNSDGQVIAYSDDDGPGLNPSLGFFLAPGTYSLGIAPFEDLNFPEGTRGKDGGDEELPDLFNGFNEFDGGRPTTENFAYKLIIGINIIPAPGAATMLGMTGLISLRRRR